MAEVLKEARTKVIHKGERTIRENKEETAIQYCERLYPQTCLLYTSPSPRDS